MSMVHWVLKYIIKYYDSVDVFNAAVFMYLYTIIIICVRVIFSNNIIVEVCIQLAICMMPCDSC